MAGFPRELEAITADYEAGPDAYAENKPASDEMLREACGWSGSDKRQSKKTPGAGHPRRD